MFAFDIGPHLAGTLIFLSCVVYWMFDDWMGRKKK